MTTTFEICDTNIRYGSALPGRFLSTGCSCMLMMCLGLGSSADFAVAAPVPVQGSVDDNIESELVQLEQYLRRNQLNGLLIDLYENELQNRQDPAERAQLAAHLSQLYGWSLNNRKHNFEEISKAWDSLVREFPENVDTRASVQVAFGHYRRARDDFGVWVRDGGDDSRREEVHQRFSVLVERTTRLIELEMKSTVDGQTSNGTGIESNEPTSEPDTGRLELVLGTDEAGMEPEEEIPVPVDQRQEKTPMSNVAIQARYVLAWSLYYRAMTSNEPARRADDLVSAVKLFHQLLQIPEGTALTELRPQWFSLDSDWNCRLLIGTGMACQASGQANEAAYCFELLREPRVPTTIRQYRLDYQFQAMVFAGQIIEANELLQTIETTGDRLAGYPDLWKTASMTGLGAWIHKDREVAYQSIALTGLRNLVVQNEWPAIDSLLDGSTRELTGDDLFVNWLEGYRSLRKAQAGRPDLIKVAVVRLRAALGQTPQLVTVATSQEQFELRARCRYHLGFALYLDQQLAAAVEQFRQAVAVLNHSDRLVAEHGLWMQCQALERMAGDDVSIQSALTESLQEFLRRYPDSARVGDVLFLQTLQQIRSQQPVKAIRSLAAIPPDDANFIRARLELCRLAHQQWSQLERTGPDTEAMRQEFAKTVIDSANDIVRLSNESPIPVSSAQQVRVCLFAADVLVDEATPDMAQIDLWLGRAAQLIPLDSMDVELRSEVCYLEMVAGGKSNDEARQRLAVDWLVNNSRRPEHKRAAWLTLAGLEVANLESEQAILSRAMVHQRRLDIIRLYANAITDDPEEEEMPNAAITALGKIALLQALTGQTQAAYDSYRRLVGADSENLKWLAGLARTATELEKWTQAVELWRRIAAALPAGNNDWLEAKYGVVRCLSELDRASALQVLQQTRLLVPEMPEPWAGKFTQIGARIESEIEFSRSNR